MAQEPGRQDVGRDAGAGEGVVMCDSGDRHVTRVRQIIGFLRDHTDGSITQRAERLRQWMDIDTETSGWEATTALNVATDLIAEMEARIAELEAGQSKEG